MQGSTKPGGNAAVNHCWWSLHCLFSDTYFSWLFICKMRICSSQWAGLGIGSAAFSTVCDWHCFSLFILLFIFYYSILLFILFSDISDFSLTTSSKMSKRIFKLHFSFDAQERKARFRIMGQGNLLNLFWFLQGGLLGILPLKLSIRGWRKHRWRDFHKCFYFVPPALCSNCMITCVSLWKSVSSFCLFLSLSLSLCFHLYLCLPLDSLYYYSSGDSTDE